MDIVSAVGLLKLVPEVLGLFNKSKADDARKIADTVTNVAEAVTGKTGDEAVAVLNGSPEHAMKFKMAVMNDKHVKDRLALANLQGARKMYRFANQKADKLADRIMSQNLWVIFGCIVTECLVIYFLKDNGALVGLISTAIGMVVQSLLTERQAVTGFYFGSSLGSKTKDGKGAK